tara:strand:+ start:232 stop:396 length:165 start_codon:yes stop_codon:yes gene_type:complete
MGGFLAPLTGKDNMKIVTSNDIGGPWQSGKEEVNDHSRRKQNTNSKKTKKSKKK